MAMRFHAPNKHRFSLWGQEEPEASNTRNESADPLGSALSPLSNFNDLEVSGRNRPEKWQTIWPKWLSIACLFIHTLVGHSIPFPQREKWPLISLDNQN
jgi:hypothetical protein